MMSPDMGSEASHYITGAWLGCGLASRGWRSVQGKVPMLNRTVLTKHFLYVFLCFYADAARLTKSM